MDTQSKETQYEVLNKETGIWTPVSKTVPTVIGNEEVIFTLETGEVVTFSNIGAIGDLQNDTHAVRIMETEGQADGTGFVTDEGVNTDEAPVAETVTE